VPALERDGVALHYEVHGSGDGVPVLLSHGFGASSAMWRVNLPALAAARSVITWDMRGHGDSDSPRDPALYTQAACLEDMAAVLDACAVDRAVLGGHSLGGYLSLTFHGAHPERVAALALISTGPGFKRDEGRAEWNRGVESIAARLDHDGLAGLRGGPEITGGRKDPVGLALAARGMVVQHDRAVIDGLDGIAVPTLVVVGGRDRRFLAGADHLAAKIPDATKVVLDDAGHAPNLDQPEAFDRAVLAFLARIESAPPHHF
jgi:pimeloyl-ACP methyl ester carboxylesterase